MALSGCGGLANPLPHAFVKVTNGRLPALTLPELQVYVSAVSGGAVELTAAQAGAVLAFFVDNGIQTLDDIQTVVDLVNADPAAIVVTPEVFDVLRLLADES